MKRERIKMYKSKKVSAMILAALLLGTAVPMPSYGETVNKGDTKVHYFSVKSDEKAEGSNFDNDGAKADGSMVIGISSTSEGINSTVIGKKQQIDRE